MLEYLEPIKYGFISFPFFALIIFIPYLLIHYHKYGALPFKRVLIVYSFILYLIIAYYLVIMPLPTIEEVTQMTGPSLQLIPFTFITDLIKGIDEVGIHQFYLAPAFYTIFFNLCLTIPFGIYLKVYFKYSLSKTVFYTFLLSLFFELTQLSGLYFFYPRAYRLFDIDDLLINTIGGTIGYFLSLLFTDFVPDVDKINTEALLKGQNLSLGRRFASFSFDFIIFSFINTLIHYLFKSFDSQILTIINLIIYYILIPYHNGQTIANKFFNIKIVTNDDERLSLKALISRQLCFYFGLFVLPYYSRLIIYQIFEPIHYLIRILLMLLVVLLTFIFYYQIIMRIKKHSHLFYDDISDTKLVSCIKVK